ncbi:MULTISPECIES: cytochrome P450 [Streptomyces]|uniref:cytochrome P450 n=1 Tax=Streptomyces TaxID=1883 RepID=UPI001318695C|nr:MULTISPECIES: cytochrome P450 [Streptomyces]QGZ51323.1 cytochrome P450 [Streptomyces sp. QHH-9511]GGU04788.1 biflaviolin synthase CYP158A2 [Streptomyces lateritius]
MTSETTSAPDVPAAPAAPDAPRPVRTWAVDDLPALEFDPLLTELLAEEPVARIRLPFAAENEAWLVTRYEDVRAVTSDPRFSRTALLDRMVTKMTGHMVASKAALNYADPPYHTQLRKAVTKTFTGQNTKRLRPLAQATTDRLLDAMEEAGRPADLMRHLHGPLPMAVVCDLLGIPEEDRAELASWPDLILSSGPGPESSKAAKAQIHGYITRLLDQRRAEPRDDLAGELAESLAGGRISTDEAVSLAMAILISGAHAVRNNSANMVYLLLTRPDLTARLRAEPELLPQAVDELLRWIPHRNGVGLPRIATEDVEIGGVLIRAGEAVYASYLAANRDPSVFEDPHEVDFDRTGTGHVSFGHGPHHCMGAMLTRMESEVMISTLLRRYPELRLAGRPEDVVFQSKGLIRGPRELVVTW